MSAVTTTQQRPVSVGHKSSLDRRIKMYCNIVLITRGKSNDINIFVLIARIRLHEFKLLAKSY